MYLLACILIVLGLAIDDSEPRPRTTDRQQIGRAFAVLGMLLIFGLASYYSVGALLEVTG